MPVYILAAARTPLGAFGGALRPLGAPALGAHALRETLARGPIEPDLVDEVILGCALPACTGGLLARTAALAAGIPAQVPAHTPCLGAASGLKAIALAAQGLQQGAASFILAGGAESLSSVPYVIPGARWGVRMGEAELLDSLLLDGPPVALEAEALALRLGLPRPSQDAWSQAGRQKAFAARASRSLEIAPLTVAGRLGARLLSEDEAPEASRVSSAANLAAPADGAATLLLASSLPPGAAPLGRILGWAETGSGCATAIRRLLLHTGLRFQDITHWELHEPSAAHVLALLAELPEIDPARVNPGGGALALGDPLGASGARLLVSLAHQTQGLQTGIAAISGGQGLALAMAITRS